MSNYNSLKATIDANIKQNGNQEITGQILNSVLNQMVTTLGAGYQFAGVATTATNPGTPDAKVFYIANGKGTYEKFGGINVTEDDVVVLYWDSSWHKVSTGIASEQKLSELAAKVGDMADLNTIHKSTIVAAINEVMASGGASYFVTPQKYGAVGDGVTDDTEAIEAALANNETVVLPMGTYAISRPINAGQKFRHLLGIGKPTIKVASVNPIPYILGIDGSLSVGIAPYWNGVGYVLKDIQFNCDDALVGLRLFGVFNSTIDSCRFTNSSSTAGSAHNKQSVGIQLAKGYDDGGSVRSCWALNIENCSFTRLLYGIQGVSEIAGNISSNFETTNINRCYFGSCETAIKADNFKNNRISGGWIELCNNAVRITLDGSQNFGENVFNNVDFENNESVIGCDALEDYYSTSIIQSFNGCTFYATLDSMSVFGKENAYLLDFFDNEKTSQANIDLIFSNCFYSSIYKLVSPTSKGVVVGIVGVPLVMMNSTGRSSVNIAPCRVCNNTPNVRVPFYRISRPSLRQIRVDFVDWVYVQSLQIYKSAINWGSQYSDLEQIPKTYSILYYYQPSYDAVSANRVIRQTEDAFYSLSISFPVMRIEVNFEEDVPLSVIPKITMTAPYYSVI